MNRKWFWVGVPLVAVLAVAASVLLRDRSAPLPEDEGTPAQRIEDVLAAPDTPALPAAPPSGSTLEDVSDFARLQRLQALRELAAAAAIAAAGDLTTSSLTGDGLGYLDVHAIINNNDPSSIVAFLQAHSDETGADESLEIEIRDTLDYPTRKKVLFDQLIDGKHLMEGQGDITFDPATGAVHHANAWLVTPDPALAASVVILQDEAVAIARAFVTSAVLEEKTVAIESGSGRVGVRPRLRPGFAFQISRATPKEIRYALDPETNKTRAEWPVWIGARGVAGGLSWEVLVDASTGEIAGINDLVQRYAGGCSDLTFRVCDGSLMSHEDDECGEGNLHSVKPLPDTDPVAARVIGQAKAMTAKIKGVDSSYIGAVRGSDCEVEIVVNVPDALMGNDAGQYDSDQDRILLHEDEFNPATARTRVVADRDTVAHEVMHALTKTRSGGVEHGLVTAAEALFMCGADNWWRYDNSDFTGTPPFVSSATHHSVTHAIYRIHRATDKDTAFSTTVSELP